MPKILLVDDEEDQEDLMRQRLTRKKYLAGYDLLFARNGIQALHLLENQEDIDLALIDINMPDIDGFQLLKRARKILPKLIVIFISAFDDIENMDAGLSLGATEFISKPINFEQLDEILMLALQNKRI